MLAALLHRIAIRSTLALPRRIRLSAMSSTTPPTATLRRRSLRLRGIDADSAGAGSDPAVTETAALDAKPAKKRKVTKVFKSSKEPVQKLKSLPKTFEKRLWQRDLVVAGVDEAGRGPLAGPVVAAACIVTADVDIAGITDSKATKEVDRERAYEELMRHPGVRHGIGIVDAAQIDEINILQATFRAMELACRDLPGAAPTAVLIDGNHVPPGIAAQHVECVIKGDSVCFSIAAASIIAKVIRDRLMLEAHAKWPEYGFAQHKGYGTKAHMAAVRRLGPCPIHRLTFRPLPEVVAALKIVPESEVVPSVAKGKAAGEVNSDVENVEVQNLPNA